jgi:hypothetical protein
VAVADRSAGGGGLSSGRARPAGGRRARSDPRARCRVRVVGRPRLGRTVAWATAISHPEVVDRLAILNAAHPRRLNKGLRNPNPLRELWYFFFFQLPGLPERIVRAAHWRFFRRYQRDARPPYTPEDTERYVES